MISAVLTTTMMRIGSSGKLGRECFKTRTSARRHDCLRHLRTDLFKGGPAQAAVTRLFMLRIGIVRGVSFFRASIAPTAFRNRQRVRDCSFDTGDATSSSID